jgi:hypothetical protein
MKELNQEYEIVDLDELHGEIHYQLYVRLPSGEIKKAEYLHRTEMIGVHVRGDRYDIGKHYLEAFGIELLRVAPKTPVSFEGEYLGWDHDGFGTWIVIGLPNDGSDILSKINFTDKRKFQLTQIVEEGV